MRGIALLALTALLAGGAQALSKEECQEKESEFLAEFEGLKAVEVDKQGGPLACVSANSTGSWVNCDAHRCISEALRVAGEYEEYFPSLCPPSEGLSSEETTAKLETLQHMTECNECVVHYTRFQRLQARLEAEKCFPTALSYSCDEDCVGSLDEYSRLSNEMLMGICRMHNPGGCGDMGGVTEGEIYDILNGMTTEMARVNAVVAMCAGDCEDHIAAWMAKWQPLVAEGCISSPDLDLAKAGDLTLQSFTLLEQCGEECRGKISDLIKDYHHLHVSCPKGLVADHKGSLENSISSNQCKDEDAWGELSMQTLAKSFFALSILCLGSFFAYILGSMGYNRCVKGKRGWDCVPSLLCCCRPRSSQASQAKARRHRLEEEEEMVLYDSEDADDDHL